MDNRRAQVGAVSPEMMAAAREAARKRVGEQHDLSEIREYLADATFAENREDSIIRRLNNDTGDMLRWKNVSCDYEKMNDVELLFASGYDMKFVRYHQVVRQIVDTAIRLKNEGKIVGISHRKILESMKYGADGVDKGIYVNTLKQDGKLDGGLVDLYEEAHLENIRKFYEVIPLEDRPFPIEELEQKYRNKEIVELTIVKRDDEGKPIMGPDGNPEVHHISDLFVEIERRTISEEEFEYYYDSIGRYQVALQDLSDMRDQSTMDHHSEKAGHAQLIEGINGEWIYMPASVMEAQDYALGDVPKTSASFRAEGHVHEYGTYNEDTGINVKIHRKTFEIFRGDVTDHYAFGKTRARNYKNAMGLSQGEAPMLDKDSNTMWFGRRVRENGSVKHGKVYTAMESHYNKEYQQQRGYGITEYEKGDKIMTDIICKHFALNPRDWIMSYYAATKLASPERAMRGGQAIKDNEVGKPTLVFYAKLPPGETSLDKNSTIPDGVQSNEYGELRINGFTALEKYVRWRVSLGEVSEIQGTGELESDILENMSRDITSPKKDTAPEEEPVQKEEANQEPATFELDHTPYTKSFVDVLHVLTTKAEELDEVLRVFAGETDTATVTTADGPTQMTLDDMRKQFVSALESNTTLYADVMKMTGERYEKKNAAELVERLQSIASGKDGLTLATLRKEATKSLPESAPAASTAPKESTPTS